VAEKGVVRKKITVKQGFKLGSVGCPEIIYIYFFAK
jgi:hypothetical protein